MAEKATKALAEGLAGQEKAGKVETELGVAILAKALVGGRSIMTISFPDFREKWVVINGKVAPVAWPMVAEAPKPSPTLKPVPAKVAAPAKVTVPPKGNIMPPKAEKKVAPAPAKASSVPPPTKKEGDLTPILVEQLDYHGNPEKVDKNIYSNMVICPNDGRIRYVKNSDVFQVRLCKPCAKKERRRRRDKGRKLREQAAQKAVAPPKAPPKKASAPMASPKPIPWPTMGKGKRRLNVRGVV